MPLRFRHNKFNVLDLGKSLAFYEEAPCKKTGCRCSENKALGVYFIHDPNDYWFEIIPRTR